VQPELITPLHSRQISAMKNELDAETKVKDFIRIPLPPVSIHSSNGMSIQIDPLSNAHDDKFWDKCPHISMSDSSYLILLARVGSGGRSC
jgi:hypothetical protein